MVLLVVGFQLLIQVKGQPEKAYSPILVTLVGIVTVVSPEHSWKACAPILVTIVGMLTDINPDCLKTPILSEVTLVGMMIDCNAVHPSKANASIVVTLVGIVILVIGQ